ncbi:Sodium/calcium exchanger protein-domain-containing protein [Vararia minispora EC-137]|uniref:Sodium/calcium exchanger protein-domain-containing protein n=1 Tax=Vararia minispora EC-137 TaxID=1314806 RepID=A0ACB8QN25_9AGAM|nr:Sodium/calcium exchanger protein-domain-containing protein [Vararia minispora EC-137]
MIPLVRLHDLTTGELAVRLGGAKAGLLNSSLGNLVELVVATTALRKCQLRVVQASLIGSMLSKLLLVLGLCLFAGGLRFSEQYGFDPAASQIHSSLLSISVGALLMPAAYHFSLSGGTNVASKDQKADILKMSRGVAIILLIVYIAYLAFHFYSHSYLFKDNMASTRHEISNPLQTLRSKRSNLNKRFTPQSEKTSRSASPTDEANRPSVFQSSHSIAELSPYGQASSPYASASDISIPLTTATSATLGGMNYGRSTAAAPAPALESTVRLIRHGSSPVPATQLPHDTRHPNPEVDEDRGNEREDATDDQPHELASKQPRLSYPLTLACLVVAAILVSLNAERLVEALEIMENTNESISTEWIGLIILPTVSCVAECITAVNVSRKDQLTLSISVAVGSTIQTALFVIPLMVVFGWILNKPLGLLFDPFETMVLFMSVYTMGYVIADGKSNWLEGALLICLYVIIAVAFWFYPGSTFSSTLAVCSADNA